MDLRPGPRRLPSRTMSGSEMPYRAEKIYEIHPVTL